MENQQNMQEDEIDLSQYVKVIVKRKKTLIVVSLLTLAIGLAHALFSPKIYRISMMIQPPVVGQSLIGANDLEAAENLKSLIINGAFNENLRKKLKLDPDKDKFEIKVVNPLKTNLLQVSVDLESKKKEFGVVLLRNLSEIISSSYANNIEAANNENESQIKASERAILTAKEKAKSLQDQIREVGIRETKLEDEITAINLNTKQILSKREELLENKTSAENESILLLLNFMQNNLSYSNQLNNQFSDLSIRRVNLNLEFKSIDSQISDFQATIEKLKISKNFIKNLRIVAQPRVSPNPVSPSKKKALAISIAMGLFLGVFAIFLQEFWQKSKK